MIIRNSHGLSISFHENGTVNSMEADHIRISLKASTPFSKPGANIFIRKRNESQKFISLLEPEGKSAYAISADAFLVKGNWEGIDYVCMLQLSKESLSWQFMVETINTTENPVELDLVYVQDVGLKSVNAGLINEYYVSQYIERLVLHDQTYGSVICCRQNMAEAGTHPWLMVACRNGALAGSTDGMQFYGKTYRETGIPEGMLADMAGGEYAGESSVVALQAKPFTLAAGKSHKGVFVATFLHDHPEATEEHDLHRLTGLMHEFGDNIAASFQNEWMSPVTNLFNTSPFLPTDELTNKELDQFFGNIRHHREEENSRLLSFFTIDHNHIVLKTKELLTDRPHGHIMQAKAGLVPDENIVSTTSFMFGVFNSHLTQGNTNFNTLLSVCTSPFNLSPESGQRIFVEIDDKHYLLGVPSAFEIGLNHCRWIYKHGKNCFQVRTWTSKLAPQVNMDFKVLSGNDVRLIITHDFDGLNGWKAFSGNESSEYFLRPKPDSMIADKFPDAQFRLKVQGEYADFRACGDELLYAGSKSLSDSMFVLDIPKTSAFCISFLGEVCSRSKIIQFENTDEQWLSDCNDAGSAWHVISLNLTLEGKHADLLAIREILPWYGMNALTHYLTPYGLEQFSGAAWGTRDVAQGPIELLLCMEKYEEAKQVLRIIFSNQNPDGGWPQWWMFDSYSNIRAHDSHGDVVYWCIIALGSYIKVTGDVGILEEVLPYYHDNGAEFAEKTPISEHLHRLLNLIIDSFLPGTALVPFGGGDWNDSLQPVSKNLASRMISSWTVEMNFQAFNVCKMIFELTGNNEKAEELAMICQKIKTDFNKYLVKDGVVAGYGLVEKNNDISLLLHPDDSTTGIHYSILPMERGILSGIFTKDQALHHRKLIEMHLKGPDGARLMDRPLQYKGGVQTMFQRAESSTFFGREIGLMYMHEHIRYAELLAVVGEAEAFMKALRQAIPVAYRDIVPCGDVRQSNCYYSSSDVVFKSRYEADQRYDEIKMGNLSVKGGWRVYSSGPGIFICLIVNHLLGLRLESGNIILDPVMPFSMDGFSAGITFLGRSINIHYRVINQNYGPESIAINGKTVPFSRAENQYRKGGAYMPKNHFYELLNEKNNILEITL